ncbi:MAG TPA: M23 family metallopeptidase, partial [bacterium]
MPFPLKRRVLLFLLLDAAILLILVGAFAAVNHAFAPKPLPLNERPFLMSPKSTETPGAPSKIPTEKPSELSELSPDSFSLDPVDLSRLLCKKIKVVVHKIESGENYWSIAKDNSIDLNTLIGANPGMPFKASINQPLNVPSLKGVLHVVGKAESLSSIASEYKIDQKVIKGENGLSWWKRLHPGDVLFIPNVKAIRMTAEWRKYFGQRGMFGVPFANWGKGWTSGFGWRTDPITGEEKLHKGMDFKAKYGDSVFAAGNGRVIFAGVSGGYGNLIQIKHSNGYLTYYGHLSKIYMKSGQKVRRGTLIGRVGAT